jgi:hypothetical protein
VPVHPGGWQSDRMGACILARMLVVCHQKQHLQFKPVVIEDLLVSVDCRHPESSFPILMHVYS